MGIKNRSTLGVFASLGYPIPDQWYGDTDHAALKNDRSIALMEMMKITTGPNGSHERTPTPQRDVGKRILRSSLSLLSVYAALYIFAGYDLRVPFTQRDLIMLFTLLLYPAFPSAICLFVVVFGVSRFVAGRYFREKMHKSSLIIVIALAALLGFAFGVSDYYSADGDTAVLAIRHGIKFSLGFVFIVTPATIILNWPIWVNKGWRT